MKLSNPFSVVDHFEYVTDLDADEILSKSGPLATPLPSACEVKVFDESGTLIFWLMGDYIFRFMLMAAAQIRVVSGESETLVSVTYRMPKSEVLRLRIIQTVSLLMGVGLSLVWIGVIRDGWSAMSDDKQFGMIFATVVLIPLFIYSIALIPLSAYPTSASKWLEETLELRKVVT